MNHIILSAAATCFPVEAAIVQCCLIHNRVLSKGAHHLHGLRRELTSAVDPAGPLRSRMMFAALDVDVET